MTRAQKIDFLKGVLNGTRSIGELNGPKVEVWENIEGDDHNIIETITGRVLSKTDYSKRAKPHLTIMWADE